MSKKLKEMTLEELWALFPIFLVKYQDCWRKWYEEEKVFLDSVALKDFSYEIHHIGSTAIDKIWAKPIIDILIETQRKNFLPIKARLIENGYILMLDNKSRLAFNKGYTEKGFAEKVFHLHLREYGDNDEVYFCTYLNVNPDVASEYEKLKLSLWKQFEHDRDGYTNAKHDFIKKHTKIAKKTMKN